MSLDRERFYSEAESKGYKLISYVSSRAMLCDNKIGENCFILGGSRFSPLSRLATMGRVHSKYPMGEDLLSWCCRYGRRRHIIGYSPDRRGSSSLAC